MNPINPLLQNPNDILSAIQTLGSQLATNVPQITIPTLNVQLPSASDLDQKYQDFLTRASNDPDIINYYNQLLQQAQGDTQIATNFLEQDYQTGVRNVQENLKGSLQSLGLTFGQEQQNLEDTLNRRGIALTQDPNDSNKTVYAGEGQAGYELGNLNESQQLRQEAEKRSASQGVTSLSQNLNKGITSANQQLTQTAQNLNQQKQQAIANRANTYYGLYQSQQAAQQQQALMKQQNQLLAGGGGLATGDPKNMTQDQRQALWSAQGKSGIAPVGFGG